MTYEKHANINDINKIDKLRIGQTDFHNHFCLVGKLNFKIPDDPTILLNNSTSYVDSFGNWAGSISAADDFSFSPKVTTKLPLWII